MALSDLEAQLVEQEAHANSVIATWQKSCTTLEEQVKDLANELEEAKETEAVLRRQLQETQHAFDEAREEVECGGKALEESRSK